MSNIITDPTRPYCYTRTVNTIGCLLKRYKGIISLKEAGKSTQGRKIYVIKLGCGRRKILFAAAIHGREYVTIGFLLHCAELYAQAYAENTDICGKNIREALREYSFYIVPQSNPDSVEIALGKAKPRVQRESFCAYTYKDNANGVNINANFPFMWQEVPQERNPGRSAASERETRFLMGLCEKYSFEKMISLHIRGGCVYWRDAGNGEVSGDKTLAENISKLCGLKLCIPTMDIKAYSGGFENWFRHRFIRPAVCVELVDDEDAGFDLCCENFYEYTDWQSTRNILAAVL